MAEQKTIFRIVIAVVLVPLFLFIAIPCCATSFIVYKFDKEKSAEAEANRQRLEKEAEMWRKGLSR